MFSDEIRKLVKKERETIDLPRNKKEFIENLIFCYQYMVASHNLTLCAARNSTGKLAEYFTIHAGEESGHDRWLKEDLAENGIFVTGMAINPYAEAMAGGQYYNVFHNHPAYLLGYMAFLEMEPITENQVEELEKAYGTSLLKTLRFHSEHDVSHSRDLCKMLDLLEEPLRELVVDSVKTTAEYFRCALKRKAHYG